MYESASEKQLPFGPEINTPLNLLQHKFGLRQNSFEYVYTQSIA